MKKMISVLLISALAFSLCACSSGKSEQPSQSQESSQTQEQLSEENSETSSQPDESSNEVAEVNESGLRPAKTAEDEVTEDDLQELLTYIGKAVEDEYLTPNDIDPATFVWPSDTSTFRYFHQLLLNYSMSTLTGRSPDPVEEKDIPSSPDKEIMDAVYDGLINWLNEFESVDYEYLTSLTQVINDEKYILEYIPANVTFE